MARPGEGAETGLGSDPPDLTSEPVEFLTSLKLSDCLIF